MRRRLALAAVLLPVLGTLGSIAAHQWALRDATVWRIPITGYDPRDPLRGHYLAFRYSWAARGDAALCDREGCRLCLEEGGARVLVARRDTACAAAIDPVASDLTILHGQGSGPPRITAAARLWIPEARAPSLQEQLRTRPMIAVARLTRDGRLLAERLEPAR